MKNFLANQVKMLGVSDGGISCLIYAIYLKCFGKLSYEEEIFIKPEMKEKYIQLQVISLFLYFVITLSFIIIYCFTTFHKITLIIVYILLLLGVYFYKISKQNKYLL